MAAAVLLFLAAAAAAGYALVRFFGQELTRAERVAWSFAAGLLLQAVLELMFLAAGVVPGPGKLLAAEAAIALASFLLRRPAPRAAAAPSVAGIAALGLALAAAGSFLFLFAAACRPMWTTDFLAIWGLKGKTIAATAAVPDQIFHDPAWTWTHPEYPLLVPLTFASLSASIGEWNDQALALLYPACQWATVLLVWGFLGRRFGQAAAAAGSILVGVCFPLYAPVNVGTAEIPLALGLALSAAAASDGLENEALGPRLRLAIASLFCAAAKQEGTLFLVLLGAALLLDRRGRSRFLWLWAVLPAALHGVLLRLLRGSVVRRDFDLSFLLPGRWTEFVSRLGTVAAHLATVEALEAAVALAAIVLFIAVTRRGGLDWLAAPLAAQVAVYAVLCALSAFGPIWHLGILARLTLTLFPVLAMVLAARLPSDLGAIALTAPSGY